MKISVELMMVYSDGCGRKTYEMVFVDENDKWGHQLEILPTGELKICAEYEPDWDGGEE